eukprot:scaffold191599_cov27-Tisochrysis_lutea.AAC.1
MAATVRSGGELGGELGEDLLHLLVERRINGALLGNLGEDGGRRPDIGHSELVEVATRASIDANDLILEGHRHILVLLEELSEAGAAVEEVLGGGVEIRAELGEGGDLAVLGELELKRAGDLLHRLALGSRADTGHRETDVDGRTDAAVEELGLEEDLAVGDGDDVGGDVCGHIASLGLNDGECGHGATKHLLGHLRGALKEARVQVEDVTGVGLAAGRAAEQ